MGVQDRLRPAVRTEPLAAVRTVAGLDVGYAPGDDRLVAAVVVLDTATLSTVESVTETGRPEFPYVPGLFAFRELPPLLRALRRLDSEPDLLVCDGFGRAHPRRFGLACHLGVLLDRPVLGVAKSPFVGSHGPLDRSRGAWSPLRADDGAEVGRALRTRDGVKPVYVSVGHRVDLDTGCDLVLRLSPRYRQPEPIRAADRLSRSSPIGDDRNGPKGPQRHQPA
nr:endonuclease V [Murinocardiopsis flavida]